jgi:uncharacterized membrane protein
VTLAVSTYQLSLFIHITAAIVGLGAPFAESFLHPVAMRLDPRHLPFKHRLQLWINAALALPALVVLFATGLYQASEADYDLGAFWLSGTMGIVSVLAIMLGAYFIPEDLRLQRLVERELAASVAGGTVTLSSEYRRRVLIEEWVGHAAGVLVIAAVYLMVVKPGL